MCLRIFFLLFAVFGVSSFVGNITPAMSLEADAASEKDRLEAARELVRVIFEQEEEALRMPPVPEKDGDKNADKRFQDLLKRSHEANRKIMQMYAPLTREKRYHITTIFLARKFSAVELRDITKYFRTGINRKIEDISFSATSEALHRCIAEPSFDIELNEKNPLVEKLSVVRKIVEDMDLTATILPLIACFSLILENKLANELTIEELNTALAFEASETGRKFDTAGVDPLRQQ